MVVNLKQGSREEHLDTLRRAKADGVRSVWSGHVRRNAYLAENLDFGVDEGIIELEHYDDREAQESGWNIKWLKDTF